MLKICKFLFGDSVKLLDPSIDYFEQDFEHLLIAAISSLPFFLIQFISAIWDSTWNKLCETVFDSLDTYLVIYRKYQL